MECPSGAELKAMSIEQKEAIFDRPGIILNITRLGAIDISNTESFEGFGDLKR
jgi:hypothetical protein